MTDLDHLQRLATATLKAEKAERALNLLNAMTSAHWRRLASTERRQIYRAIADQRDTLRRLNTKVDRIIAYKNNERVCRGNLPQGLKS